MCNQNPRRSKRNKTEKKKCNKTMAENLSKKNDRHQTTNPRSLVISKKNKYKNIKENNDAHHIQTVENQRQRNSVEHS